MSNDLSIAAVTATLQDRLSACAGRVIPGATIVAARPDAKRQAEPTPGVNLFLYEIVSNPYLRNQDLPTRRSDGSDVHEPLAAVDLHYLLTFNGRDNVLEPQRLAGAVISELTSRPMLTADEIQRSIDARSHLAACDLALQVEVIALAPLNLNLEELSRLWSVLMHEPYSLSLQYQASVVMLRSTDGSPTARRRVEARRIRAEAGPAGGAGP